jgi:hypothetical protein
MIMTDQDHDGSHIKARSKRVETQSLRQQDPNVPGQGLIINFIHHWFPSLVRRDRTPDELELDWTFPAPLDPFG